MTITRDIPTLYCHTINDEEIIAYTSSEFKKLLKEYKITIKFAHMGSDAFYYEIISMKKKKKKDSIKKQVTIIN